MTDRMFIKGGSLESELLKGVKILLGARVLWQALLESKKPSAALLDPVGFRTQNGQLPSTVSIEVLCERQKAFATEIGATGTRCNKTQ